MRYDRAILASLSVLRRGMQTCKAVGLWSGTRCRYNPLFNPTEDRDMLSHWHIIVHQQSAWSGWSKSRLLYSKPSWCLLWTRRIHFIQVEHSWTCINGEASVSFNFNKPGTAYQVHFTHYIPYIRTAMYQWLQLASSGEDRLSAGDKWRMIPHSHSTSILQAQQVYLPFS